MTRAANDAPWPLGKEALVGAGFVATKDADWWELPGTDTAVLLRKDRPMQVYLRTPNGAEIVFQVTEAAMVLSPSTDTDRRLRLIDGAGPGPL